MRRSGAAWPLAGLVAGVAGLATSYLVAMVLAIRESPVVAVAELVIRYVPGPLAEWAVQVLGSADKPALVGAIVVGSCCLFAYVGGLARRSSWAPPLVFGVLAAIGAAAVLRQRASSASDVLPVAVGLGTWLVCLPLLTAPLRRADPRAERGRASIDGAGREGPEPGGEPTRRGFVLRLTGVAAVAGALGLLGRRIGRGRRRVEEARSLLRLTGVSEPRVPARATLGVTGVAPWVTPAEDFYRIDTAIVVPTIEPVDWTLRIHGLVDRELVLTYDDLVARRLTEGWVTLSCVSNPVGGSLVGNAWWSGVRIAGLLREAGVHPDADAVRQTSADGWTCGTPLEPLTDDRLAILAVAMNGRPLPVDHGFPVRTIVPGLYGYVSATKWVVDLEVTRFDRFEAYWTTKGWAERGPVKLTSRVDVPASGAEVVAGDVRFAGVAWSQHTGIEAVEVAVDGGAWRRAEVSGSPSIDTWVQWAITLPVAAGDHLVRVRAVDRAGLVQTGVERDVLPDGATGWHTRDFTATS